MNTRKAVLLLAFLVCGGALLWFKNPNGRPSSPLFTDLSGLRFVELENHYTLMMRGNRWTTAEGIAADPKIVDEILSTLQELQLKKLASGERDSESDFGLAAPEYTLNLEMRGEKKTVILGKKHPLSGERYASLVGDSSILLLDDKLFGRLIRSEVWQRQPLGFNSEKLTRLVVERGGLSNIRFDRSGDEWRVASGEVTLPVDREFFEEKVRNLSALRASDVTVSERELPTPSLRLIGELRDGELVKVEFFQVQELGKREVLFRIPERPELYALEGRFFSEFLQPPVYFRDRRPLSRFDTERVKWFSVERGEKSVFTVRKGEGEWSLSQGFGGSEQKSVTTDLLKVLSHLRVLSYYDPDGIEGGETPSSPIHLRLQGEERQIVLSLVRPLTPENRSDVPWFVAVKGGKKGEEELFCVVPGEAVEGIRKEVERLESELAR